jgi:amino acid transporter
MFAAQLIFALVQLQNPDFDIHNYYTALTSILIGTIVTAVNVWGAKKLALLENVFVTLHVVSFLVVLITVAVASPKNDAKEVFTTFTDNGGNYPLRRSPSPPHEQYHWSIWVAVYLELLSSRRVLTPLQWDSRLWSARSQPCGTSLLQTQLLTSVSCGDDQVNPQGKH